MYHSPLLYRTAKWAVSTIRVQLQCIILRLPMCFTTVAGKYKYIARGGGRFVYRTWSWSLNHSEENFLTTKLGVSPRAKRGKTWLAGSTNWRICKVLPALATYSTTKFQSSTSLNSFLFVSDGSLKQTITTLVNLVRNNKAHGTSGEWIGNFQVAFLSRIPHTDELTHKVVVWV